MKKLIFATHNPGKLIELKELVSVLSVSVKGAKEAGVFEDVVEDGKTFAENALKKARFVAEQTGEWSAGDDSGIEIKALDGRPGVYTARWAGEGADDATLVSHTLSELKDVPVGEREAVFHCVIALVSPEGEEWLFDGIVEGEITLEPHGENRYKLPYDLIFKSKGYDKTFAQMTDEEKNALSHRGRAFQKLKAFIANRIDQGTEESDQ